VRKCFLYITYTFFFAKAAHSNTNTGNEQTKTEKKLHTTAKILPLLLKD